jgi:hypothetical protein
MKIDAIRTIRIDDLKSAGGEIPAWLDPFLYQLNGFIEVVGKAVQGNLTFSENLFSRVKTYTLTHGVELEINPQVATRVLGVVPVEAVNQKIDKFGFTRKSSGNLGLTVSYDGGTAQTTAACTVLILLG